MRQLFGLHLRFASRTLSAGHSQAPGREVSLPVALFWLLILDEVRTLLLKTDCVPATREGMCSTQPPREPGSEQRDWETSETNVPPAGFREEGKTDFSLGLRGTGQGSLQTGSLVELTKDKPRG